MELPDHTTQRGKVKRMWQKGVQRYDRGDDRVNLGRLHPNVRQCATIAVRGAHL